LEEVLDLVGNSDDFIISTTGYTSRELYAIHEERRKDSQRPAGGELYMVGSRESWGVDPIPAYFTKVQT